MTAKCQLCGTVIRIERAPMLLDPGTDAETAAAVAEISAFDLLAAKMANHLNEHSTQAAEMSAVMFLAGKVYAMTWAECPQDEPNYSKLRESWRTGILQMMHATSDPVPVYDAGAAEGGASSPSGCPPEGSKEKKSVRKTSN